MVRVRVQPGASRAGFDAVDAWRQAFVLRVRAPAREGAANREVLSVVAETLRVPPSAVSLRAGERAREKEVFVAGVTAGEVVRRVEAAR